MVARDEQAAAEVHRPAYPQGRQQLWLRLPDQVRGDDLPGRCGCGAVQLDPAVGVRHARPARAHPGRCPAAWSPGTRCRPAGAYDGATLLITAVLTTGPPEVREASSSIGSVVGASAAANHHVASPFIRGTAVPASRPVVTGSAATTTARAVRDPAPVSTETPEPVRRTPVTSVDRWTGEVSAAETCPGSAAIPPAGTAGRPRTKLRSSSRADRAEVRPGRLGQHPGEERVPDVVAERTGDARTVQRVGQAAVLAGEQPVDAAERRGGPGRQTGQLRGVQIAAAHGAPEQARRPHRIGLTTRVPPGPGRATPAVKGRRFSASRSTSSRTAG